MTKFLNVTISRFLLQDNQKLVKKIEVRGITVKGLSGTNAYLYLESIEVSKKAPVVRIEMEVRQGNGSCLEL